MTLILRVANWPNDSFDFSLESLGLDVDHEYRKLNEWYKKCDALRPWLDSTENISNAEVGNENTVTEVKEKLPTVKVILSFFVSLQPLEGTVIFDSKRKKNASCFKLIFPFKYFVCFRQSHKLWIGWQCHHLKSLLYFWDTLVIVNLV